MEWTNLQFPISLVSSSIPRLSVQCDPPTTSTRSLQRNTLFSAESPFTNQADFWTAEIMIKFSYWSNLKLSSDIHHLDQERQSKENMHESLKIIFHESSVPRTRACAPAFCMHSTYLHIKPLLKTLPQRHRYQCNFTMQRCLYFSGHNDQQFGWNIMNINLTAQVLRNSVYHLLIRRKDDVGKKVIQTVLNFSFHHCKNERE